MVVWTKKTEMDVLPEDEGWTLVLTGGSANIYGGILTINTTTLPRQYIINWGANNTTGTTGECRIKRNPESVDTCAFALYDGIKFISCSLYPNFVRVSINDSHTDISVNTSEYHIYRLTLKNETAKLYIDGYLKTSGYASSQTLFNMITFFQSGETESYWDYVYYSTDGAFEPDITEDIYPDPHNKITINCRTLNFTLNELISGSIRKSPNSANTCELVFHNPSGAKTHLFKQGDNIKIYMGLSGNYHEPVFDGYIYDIYKDSSPTNLPIKISCLDYIGRLNEEKILIDNINNYDGWENLSAIRDIVTNCTGGFFTKFIVSGTDDKNHNIQTITKENNIRSNYDDSRLNIIKKINNNCFDDSNYPSAPQIYYFWQENNYDNTTGEIRRFVMKKITSSAGDITPIKTLNYGNTLFDSSLSEQTEGCINTCVVKNTNNKFFVYTDYTGVINILNGVKTQTVTDNTLVNTDDCQKKAIRLVELFKKPIKSLQVRHREGFILKPLDVVRIINPRYGIDQNFFIIDVDISFNSNMIDTVLTLGSERPYITTYL